IPDPPDGGGGPGMSHRSVGPVIRVSGRLGIDRSPLEYRPGEVFEALCIASRAYPPAELAWFINGRRVPKHFLLPLQSMVPRPEAFNTFTTELWIKFQVEDVHFDRDGHVQLTCNATLAHQYTTSAHILLENPLMRRPMLSGFFSNTCGRPVEGSASICALCLLIIALAGPRKLYGESLKHFASGTDN
ncbi:Immunoglobulin-like domain, partial [Trinorchestia longiramus]